MIVGAESFYSLEGNMCGTAMRGAVALPGSKATSLAVKDRIGTGRSRVWPGLRAAPVRSGRRGAVADDERTREVTLRHSSYEADEQSRATGGGAGGAKGGDQGKCGTGRHALDAEPGRRVPGLDRERRAANAASPSDTQGKNRMPELGTYGSVRGAPAMGVPTAKNYFVQCSFSATGPKHHFATPQHRGRYRRWSVGTPFFAAAWNGSKVLATRPGKRILVATDTNCPACAGRAFVRSHGYQNP